MCKPLRCVLIASNGYFGCTTPDATSNTRCLKECPSPTRRSIATLRPNITAAEAATPAATPTPTAPSRPTATCEPPVADIPAHYPMTNTQNADQARSPPQSRPKGREGKITTETGGIAVTSPQSGNTSDSSNR